MAFYKKLRQLKKILAINYKGERMGTIEKMSVEQETRARLNAYPYMKKSQKTVIRREGVINLIKSKESGHLFSSGELMRAAGYSDDWKNKSEYNKGHAFIKSMIKSGIIKRIPEPGTKKNAWVVLSDAKIVRTKRKKDIVERKVSEIVSPRAVVEFADKKEYNETTSKKTSNSSDDNSKRVYSIIFTIDKKSDSEFGKKSIAKLELHETNLDIAQEMILKTIESSK